MDSAHDLLRAGLSTAACLVVLSDPARNLNDESSIRDDAGVMLGASSRGTRSSNSNVPDADVIFSYLALEQVLMTVHLRPEFYVVVDLSSAANMHVLNAKRMSKLRIAALWNEHRSGLPSNTDHDVTDTHINNADGDDEDDDDDDDANSNESTDEVDDVGTLLERRSRRRAAVDRETAGATQGVTVQVHDAGPLQPRSPAPSMVFRSLQRQDGAAGPRFDSHSGVRINRGPFMLPMYAAGYALADDTLHTVLAQCFFDIEVESRLPCRAQCTDDDKCV